MSALPGLIDPRINQFPVAEISKTGTQSRKTLSPQTVKDIRDDIRDGNQIEPIVLFFDGASHWLADGHHRVEAHTKEGKDFIAAEVRGGTKDEALRFNIASNASADQTRWTNADKRHAVTMLLRSHGDAEVTRAFAEEIMSLAKCGRDLVYRVASELREASLKKTKPAQSAQLPVLKAVQEDHDPVVAAELRQEAQTPRPTPPALAPNGRRSVEMAERDEKIKELALTCCTKTEIAKKLGVSLTTVGDSFRRQKLDPESANPLTKVLERAQLCASEWEDLDDLLRSRSGAAASWATATKQQKKEVTDHIKRAIEFQTRFYNRLNKEAKEQ